jgi:hypothetical protein
MTQSESDSHMGREIILYVQNYYIVYISEMFLLKWHQRMLPTQETDTIDEHLLWNQKVVANAS